ncbi:MAG TPA: SDR family NAD(P)-dependent oxidoreductase [Fastidiosipila sp.]|nr:SDR family NAD(P)-dependent oxidoreductase [Fastidiosipila sp.]
MNIAIVTGASAGLGSEFARQLSKESSVDRIWLIARREDRLAEVAASLSKPVDIFALDLLDDEALSSVTARLTWEDTVTWLVNNAGIGLVGSFAEQSVDDQRAMVRLNNEVPAALTRACEPFLKDGSIVLNIASVAGFLPQPGFTTYAATKAMLISFSRALNQEWRKRGIQVTAVCPNPMETEFFEKSQARGKKTSKIKRLGLEDPEKVVFYAILNAKNGRDLSVTHPFGKLIHVFSNLVPKRFSFWVMRRLGL